MQLSKKKRNLSADERIERQETEYVGVCWNKNTQQWRAYISIARKNKTIGYFESDYEAAMRYDEQARKQGRPVNVPIHPTDIQAEKRKKS